MSTPSGHVPVTLGCVSSRSLDLGPATVVEASFAACSVLPRHSHERGSVAVMMDGSFDLELRTTTRHCAPTAVFIEPAGSSHTNRMGTAGARVVVVQPNPADQEFFRPFAHLLEEPTHRYHAGVTARAAQLADELRAADDLGALAAEGLVIDMLVTLARLPPSGPVRHRTGSGECRSSCTPGSARPFVSRTWRATSESIPRTSRGRSRVSSG